VLRPLFFVAHIAESAFLDKVGWIEAIVREHTDADAAGNNDPFTGQFHRPMDGGLKPLGDPRCVCAARRRTCQDEFVAAEPTRGVVAA
jgi:hypothetical protein